MNCSKFVISLDLELFWGVRDNKTINNYGTNIKNEHLVIPEILNLFEKYDIHATWAIVGFLFCKNKSEIMQFSPTIKPSYVESKLNPYNNLYSIGESGDTDPYHYGWDLISLIKQYKNQEIATHSFSHYYCLEAGQNLDSFRADIKSAIEVAKRNDISIRSIVFPRNQYSETHLSACLEYGIFVFRGNENHWAYASHNRSSNTKFKRLYRLIDSYVNLSGDHIFTKPKTNYMQIMDIPASRFLRPYSTSLMLLEPLKINRIKKSMKAAASSGKTFHLWWHPHNFGKNIKQNMSQLEAILRYYHELHNTYGMQSQNMEEFLID